MIVVTERNRAGMEAAMHLCPELAMFPLANLAAHGISGEGHPNASRYWIDHDPDPKAVVGLTAGGMVMVYAPDDLDCDETAGILHGNALAGITGAADPVRAVLAAAGLTGAPCRLDRDEPQFLLDLADLDVPDGPGELIPVDRHPDIAMAWRHAYESELHPPATTSAEGTPAAWVADGSYRFLAVDGVPVAMTGFNAVLPDIVQIGGVYTPPQDRSRGLARRAVALHLAEARAQGVTRATLFASSDAAVACYLSLGFRRIGSFAIVLFDGPVTP